MRLKIVFNGGSSYKFMKKRCIFIIILIDNDFLMVARAPT